MSAQTFHFNATRLIRPLFPIDWFFFRAFPFMLPAICTRGSVRPAVRPLTYFSKQHKGKTAKYWQKHALERLESFYVVVFGHEAPDFHIWLVLRNTCF